MTDLRTLEEQKEKLIEQLGCFLSRTVPLPPLSGRMAALLIIEGGKGTTFDQLIKSLGASKSSICTSLHQLEELEMATYFQKEGDRKKYFVISPNRLISRINEVIAHFKEEAALHNQLIEYKEAMQKVKPEEYSESSSKFMTAYTSFLNEAIQVFSRIKDSISTKP
ncbi:hypothetical protein V6R21_30665 [Limibacter armeniacum]|uniref:GbsR/MarR family transcriptional regulator n=1 Tax=Limibacter armeniacum TaxID=466084 RepID=UPI002FE53BA6